ncbi:MAG TPA: reverse transcriptase family protein [Solirubrobacteraceae bacterium]
MYPEAKRNELSRALAFALLAGEWDPDRAIGRAAEALRPRPRWIAGVVTEVFAAYHRPPADRPRELTAFIAVLLGRRTTTRPAPDVHRWFLPESAMGRMRWPVPELADPAALGAFLDLDPGRLEWLSDTRGLERTATDERLRNYRYVVRPRPWGPPRVIEAPKPRLKAAQRRLLHDLLDWIPAHPAAHGFTRGRSVLSHARAHAGTHVVMRLDLEDFFASVPAARVYGVFRTCGYPEAVAHALTGLATNTVPAAVWAELDRPGEPGLVGAHHRLGRRLASAHLPQGAPTSPALANLAAFGLDRRLAGLARVAGLAYTRYADDLTFSGTARLVRRAGDLRRAIRAIVEDEGFRVNERKSTLTTRAGRQTVCGLVVNDRPNVNRREYETLKAILHNAGRGDPEAQNRAVVPDFRAHLLGRIAWVESVNPSHGAKLRSRYSQITWPG